MAQDASAACPAPKVAPEEGLLAWSEGAKALHNKARNPETEPKSKTVATFLFQAPL